MRMDPGRGPQQAGARARQLDRRGARRGIGAGDHHRAHADGAGRGEHGVAVGGELGGQREEELQPRGLVELPVGGHGLARDGGAGGLAALGDERAQQRGEAVGAALRRRARHAGGGKDPVEEPRHGR